MKETLKLPSIYNKIEITIFPTAYDKNFTYKDSKLHIESHRA
jgi:hypothetical protein